ncbi:GNAT family N-acetyltransferase [Deinococcus fonticola]|uniref:GNAT family N-acetyltransferase n=1 Tax=Deinococcus fonticola TaxID=2528713 RepID=UPI001074EF62|nr:GNAT family N-acetyltransferase [Deinococcus fonticola]
MRELVRPSARYQASFIEAVKEAQAAGSGLGDTLLWNVPDIERDFEALLKNLQRYEPGQNLPEGFVHSEYRWLVDGDTYLGRVSIRHSLNERLREFGGHIGYEIRPSARRQGNATLALKLALERCREIGIDRALVTCDVENLGSRRTIEKNGGELEGEFSLDFHDKPIRRYWIQL